MLIEILRAIFTINLAVSKGEKVLVFTDRILEGETLSDRELCRRERLRDLAMLTAEIGRTFTKGIIFMEYPATGSSGAEPPEELWHSAFGEKSVKELKRAGLLTPLLSKEITGEQLKKAEALIKKHDSSSVKAVIALSNYSTSHTRFRDLLTRICGCRYASMPLFDASMLEGPMNIDWKALAKRTAAVAGIVNKAEAVEIKTSNGTHLKLSKKGRTAHADTGLITKSGSFGNLPAGEVYLAPLEGTANGKLVIEWAPTRELTSPITITVKEGFAVAVSGDEPYAEILREKLSERKDNGNIAELGIGTNNRAKRPDNILESEKILGTIHIALGDNSSFGGKVKTPFHQDFVFFKPTLTLLDKNGGRTILMKNGQFVSPE